MSLAAPIFNPQEFELRGFSNPYFNEEQQSQVNLVESRVNSQLDWLAQITGWNGPNYWGFPTSALNGVPYPGLPGTVNQKRQLLTGSFGFYNGYIYPELLSVQNWDNKVIIKFDQRIKLGQKVYLGDNAYTINSIFQEKDTLTLDLGILPQVFFEDISANEQLRIHDIALCPAPFYRPTVGVSADYTFICGRSGTTLTLYPGYDRQKTTPYTVNIFFPGSVYYFDQPVYLTYPGSLRDIPSEYDPESGTWYVQIPEKRTTEQLPPAATLVWPFYDPVSSSTSLATANVAIIDWVDPSDWGSLSTVDNFKGVWANKGGALPFNFVFDALSLHGFNEMTSVIVENTVIDVEYNKLLNAVYYQQITISEVAPAYPESGDVWWNNTTGVFAVWVDYIGVCSSWVEINYRQFPEDFTPVNFTYALTSDFLTAASTIPVNAYVEIANCANLQNSDPDILLLGLQGELTSVATAYLFKVSQVGSISVWKFVKFTYSSVPGFNADALHLPYKTPVEIADIDSLEPDAASNNYVVSNLSFVPGTNTSSGVGAILTKYYNNRTWEVSPDSPLRYIADTSLFSPPGISNPGEAWWDYDQTLADVRTASTYYVDPDSNQWVQLNRFVDTVGTPPAAFNANVVVVYCDGTLVEEGQPLMQNNYEISYTANGSSYTFNFKWSSEGNVLQLPRITISDSLTGLFRADVTNMVFNGGSWRASPNVLNSETPLRLWKTQDLQVCDTVDLLDRNTYYNPLVADGNLGAGDLNWSKYFIRLPLEYERNGYEWQQVNLICQNFAYFGTSSTPEAMLCPPEDDRPSIYEELCLIPGYTRATSYVYSEPYWYSVVLITENFSGDLDYENAFVAPSVNGSVDDFEEAALISYDPFHNRQADVTSPVGKGYGNWEGEYARVQECLSLSGFFTQDIEAGLMELVAPPTWDASIYKYAPDCMPNADTFAVDANNYKIGYAYFIADHSAANEGFFDIEQEVSWRYPQTLSKTGYITPMTISG